MCFRKSEQSKVLRAKKDIIVYKIGEFANEDTFTPYFVDSFTYKTGIQCLTCPDFKSHVITIGFHGYINILVTTDISSILSAIVQKNNKYRPVIARYSTFQYTLYLGRFIIPKGAIYCVNDANEIVSDRIIYTGQYASVIDISNTNLKELWKEKQVKYLLVMVKPIKQ